MAADTNAKPVPFKVADFKVTGAIEQDTLLLGQRNDLLPPGKFTLATQGGQELAFIRSGSNHGTLTFKESASDTEKMIYHEGNVTVSDVEPTSADGRDGDFWWVHE